MKCEICGKEISFEDSHLIEEKQICDSCFREERELEIVEVSEVKESEYYDDLYCVYISPVRATTVKEKGKFEEGDKLVLRDGKILGKLEEIEW